MEYVNGIQSVETAEVEGKSVYIKLSGNKRIIYSFAWLRDNCRCKDCYNFATFQRNKHILDIPEDAYPVELNTASDILAIKWDDQHISEYTPKFLWKYWPENWKKKSIIQRKLWMGKEVANEVAYVNRDDFLKSDETLKVFLKSMIEYGCAFVDNVEPTLEDTELVIKRVAPVQRTLFGDMWTFTSDNNRADTAYTTIPLAAHNDSTYLTEATGLQVLHCMEHDGTGGENLFVDGFHVADELRRTDPATFKTLTTVLQPAEYLEEGWHQTHIAPVISLNPINGELEQMRFNIYDRSPHCVSPGEDDAKMYSALRKISKMFASPDRQWWFKLNPGRVAFFDNWRLLHGRAGFTGRRVVGGSYVGRGDWLSAARIHGLI